MLHFPCSNETVLIKRSIKGIFRNGKKEEKKSFGRLGITSINQWHA